MTNDACVSLVKLLADGPCGCYHPMSSFQWGINPETGKTESKYEPGPKRWCLRCQARTALEADGVKHVPDDRTRLIATF